MIKVIRTKRKKAFLRFEYKQINYTNWKEFYNDNKNSIGKCKKCGIYYWIGCKKRCNCLNEAIVSEVRNCTTCKHDSDSDRCKICSWDESFDMWEAITTKRN